jgi:hypothetical protein
MTIEIVAEVPWHIANSRMSPLLRFGKIQPAAQSGALRSEFDATNHAATPQRITLLVCCYDASQR